MPEDRPQQSWNLLKGNLLDAATYGHIKDMKDLFKSCNSIDRRTILQDNHFVASLLSRALQCGHVNVAILLEENHHVDIRNFLTTDSDECNLLCAALQSIYWQSVTYLLDRGASIHKHCQSHEAPLTLACSIRDVGLVDRLVEMGAGLDGEVETRVTPLMAAVRARAKHVIKYLLRNGVNVNKHDMDGRTALHTAVEYSRGAAVKIIKILLQHGAVLQPDHSGKTPLMLAAELGKKNIVHYFLNSLPVSRISRMDTVDALELCAASKAMYSGDVAKVFDCLYKAMEERYRDPSNVLYKPESPSLPELGSFVESRSLEEISQRENDNAALFMECLAIRTRHACKEYNSRFYSNMLDNLFRTHHHTELTRILKFDPHISPYLVKRSFSEALQMFESIYRSFKKVDTELILMYLDACITCIKNYVEKGIDVPYSSSTVRTLLACIAIYMGLFIQSMDKDLLKVKRLEDEMDRLLQCLSLEPRMIYSPLNTAVGIWVHCSGNDIKRYRDLIHFLVNHNVPINCIGFHGETPLHTLARTHKAGACDMARLLLARGADVDILNWYGQTPAQIAGTDEMKKLLLSIPSRLKCIATHTILKHKISMEHLPPALQRFVRYHVQSFAERDQVMNLEQAV